MIWPLSDFWRYGDYGSIVDKTGEEDEKNGAKSGYLYFMEMENQKIFYTVCMNLSDYRKQGGEVWQVLLQY